MTSLGLLLYRIFVVIVFCSAARSLFIPSFMEFGSCSQVSQQINFDIEKFLGTWYPVLQVPNEFAPAQHCITYNYTMLGSHQVRFFENGLDEDRTTNAGELIMDLSEDEEFTFIAPSSGMRPTLHTTIMATDYTSYACMYSCLERFGFMGQFVWVLSRDPRLQRFKVEKCKAITDRNGDFDWGKMTFVEQGETCPYWSSLSPEKPSALDIKNDGAEMTQPKELEDVVVGNEEEETDAMLGLFNADDLRGGASTPKAGVIVTLFLVVMLWKLT